MCNRGLVDLATRSGVGIPKETRGTGAPQACLFLLLTRLGSEIWEEVLPVRAELPCLVALI